MADCTAADVMTRDVKTVKPDTPLGEVAALLVEHDISGVPVVDDEGHIVGIISEADLVNEKKRKAAIPKIGLFGLWTIPMETLEKAYHEGCSLMAKDLMTRKVITATEDTPLSELAEIMVTKHINRIPIVRDGKLVGIVARSDLVRGQCGKFVACVSG